MKLKDSNNSDGEEWLTFGWFMLCTGLYHGVQKVLVLSCGCTACSCNSLAPVKKGVAFKL